MSYVAESRPLRRTVPLERCLSPLELRLAESRDSRARIDSHVRDLLGRRNEAMAAAMADKVSLSAIAVVVGIRAADVKRLGGAYQDLHGSGARQEWHLAGLTAIVRRLNTALGEKEELMQRLRSDVVEGLQSEHMDIFRVAALIALPAERIRELMRPPVARSAAG